MTAQMLSVTVNGESRQVSAEATVRTLITELGLPDDGVAVAVDGEVVPGSQWGSRSLADGAQIEVLTAVQGG